MIKQTLLFHLILCFMLSCTNANSTVSNKEEPTTEPIVTTTETKKYTVRGKLKIQDPSQYHFIFLAALEDKKQNMILENDYLLYQNDTIKFPSDLVLQKTYTFKGKAATGSIFELSVTRINLTNLTYSFEQRSMDGQTIVAMNGTALLFPNSMFTGSEVQEDELEEVSFGANVYYDSYPDHCIFIHIGAELDENGNHRAKVFIESETEEVLGISDGPTLRAKS